MSKSKTAPERYHAASMSLHWIMLALILCVYASLWVSGTMQRGTPERDFVKSLHFMLGLSVGLLAWIRVAARLAFKAPAPIDGGAAATLASKALHLFLYGFMIAMPIAGWMILSAGGKPIPFFGMELPALLGPDKDLAKQIRGAHGLAGNIGYAAIFIHAAAAVWHQKVIKDGLLLRMMPLRKK